MHFRRNLLSINRKYLGGLLLLGLIAVVYMAFSLRGSDDYDFARREILLRRIGHELLLQSGDSSSRVMPVKTISKNEYQLSFEHAFSFQPETLVSITQRVLDRDPLETDYVVNVLPCDKATVVYGYAISKNKKDDIVSCLGRKQPLACYEINIKFKPDRKLTAKTGYILGGLGVLAFLGFAFFRSARPRKELPETADTGSFYVGSILFDAGARKLELNGQSTELTKTETRILRIFALSPNEPIERSRLQKEIWEDEGVIVGRSLDMFISKLRKKLEMDPNVKIAVIRGKGYKLEVGG